MEFVFNKERLKQSIDTCVDTVLSDRENITVDDVPSILLDVIKGIVLIPFSIDIASKLSSLVDYEK